VKATNKEGKPDTEEKSEKAATDNKDAAEKSGAKVGHTHKGEDEDDDWFNESDFSDQDFYDANEEFKKMFPRRKKKKSMHRPHGDEEEEEDLFALGLAVERPKLEAMRRKIQRGMMDMLLHANRLEEQISLAEADNHRSRTSGDALRALQRFIDRFAKLELSKLKVGDTRSAEKLFRRFMEHACELLCAAGEVDPAGTVAEVAMRVNLPLLSAASSPVLETRCSGLLEAIRELPNATQRLIKEFNGLHSATSRHAQNATAEDKENKEPIAAGKVDSVGPQAGADGGAGDDEDWFDDFFDTAKVAADAHRAKANQEADRHVQAEMERRQAQEAADEAERAAAKKTRAKKPGDGTDKRRERKPAARSDLFSLAQKRADTHVGTLRTAWDETWSHPCAGERRPDGSAVYCLPCGLWISAVAPFDERGFVVHCSEEGHTDWID